MCPPFNIRCRWLAGKFLLKNLSFHYSEIYNSFLDIYYSWRYVHKSLPILSSVAYSLTSTRNFIIKYNKLPLYDIDFQALFFSPLIHIEKNFLNQSPNSLKTISPLIVNNLFLDFVRDKFPNSTLIFTDGSVSPLSAGYAFHIPDLHISMSSNLPPSASSYTAECFALLEALKLISTLTPKNYLIVSDSLSSLQNLSSNVFKSNPSSISINIRNLLYKLDSSGCVVQFLWVPSHSGISGNEVADSLAKSTSSLLCPSSSLIPWTDFCSILKTNNALMWLNQWTNLPPNYSTWYRNISPTIPSQPWFHNMKLNRKTICSFSRLRLGHTLLPSHSFKLTLCDSPFCTLHISEAICDIPHILFQCPILIAERKQLYNLIKNQNVPFNSKSILSSQYSPIILSTISLFNKTGYLI